MTVARVKCSEEFRRCWHCFDDGIFFQRGIFRKVWTNNNMLCLLGIVTTQTILLLVLIFPAFFSKPSVVPSDCQFLFVKLHEPYMKTKKKLQDKRRFQTQWFFGVCFRRVGVSGLSVGPPAGPAEVQ